MVRIPGRKVSGGIAEGAALVTREPITFLGGVDPATGIVVERGHELEGESLKGRIVVFPRGKGSTVGSYVLYQMKKNGTAPRGIVNIEAEEIVALGAIIAGIPMIHALEREPYGLIRSGDMVRLDADGGYLEVY
jgi:hypothetical protein